MDSTLPPNIKRAHFDLRAGEALALGGAVCVEFVEKRGRMGRLVVTAPRTVLIEKVLLTREPSQSVPTMAA